MQAPIAIDIFTRSRDLPQLLPATRFFHSRELFAIVEQTKGQKPYMVVARREGVVVAQLLAVLRRRGSLLPPYLFTQGRIYGEGEYAEGCDREQVFSLMLAAITRKLRRRLCMYIEFSDLSAKMFSYRHFSAQGYFPVRWMQIHNSLHSMAPVERLSDKMRARIERAASLGVETKAVADYDEFRAFYRLLHSHYRFKVRRYLPPERQFYELSRNSNCRLYVTTYRSHVVGACVCVHTGGNAYLWFLASRRKSFHHLHPETVTVWNALNDAHQHACRHFFFMDVGLPYQKSPQREFILRFGGKPVGTYRWFRFTVGWLNRVLTWIYKE